MNIWFTRETSCGEGVNFDMADESEPGLVGGGERESIGVLAGTPQRVTPALRQTPAHYDRDVSARLAMEVRSHTPRAPRSTGTK